jgi:TolA-binding protein
MNDTTQQTVQTHDEPGTSQRTVEDADQANASEKLVPVSEAIRYRKRAQTAEQQLEQLNGELRVLHAKLNEANQAVSDLERRQRVDALLTEADAIDLEAARLLTEQAVRTMDDPDIELAVEDLRRHKPYLFRRRMTYDDSAMAPSLPDPGHDPAEQAAEQAAKSGDRRDLLRYLRLRRGR